MIKELEDYNWFPQLFRRFQMEYIGSVVSWAGIYQPLIPVVNGVITENKTGLVQDLCSGSGKPAMYIQEHLYNNCTTVLTDKFPDPAFRNTSNIFYEKNEVDVLRLEPKPNVCYTMYNALHHFSDKDKQKIIQKIKNIQAPFVFAEILNPDFFTLVKIIFTTTILQLLTTPFVQPFSLLRLLFTYIIPVNLFTVTYDGVISVIRSRSVKQYQLLVNNMANANYEITVDSVGNRKMAVTFIKGNPKR